MHSISHHTCPFPQNQGATSNKKPHLFSFLSHLIMYTTPFPTSKLQDMAPLSSGASPHDRLRWARLTSTLLLGTQSEQPGETTELLREALEHPAAKTAVSLCFFVWNKKRNLSFYPVNFCRIQSKAWRDGVTQVLVRIWIILTLTEESWMCMMAASQDVCALNKDV